MEVDTEKDFRTKETPLAEIPKDWKALSFADVVDGFSSGSTPSRINKSYFEGSILWITSGELNYNTIIDTKEKVTKEAVKNTNLKLLKPGTFLMAITGLEAAGTRGSCAIVGKDATTNQSCMALTPKDTLDVKFLYYFYCLYGERLAFRYCQGTKQQSYNAKLVKMLPIHLPLKSEQQKIVEILSNWDDVIKKTQQLIEQLILRKKGLMQELLTGKKRLPGFDGEWREDKLGNFFKERKDTGYNNLHLLSVGKNGVYPQDISVKKDTSNSDKSKYKRICSGDIGYNTMRMWQGRSALSSMEGIVSPAYTILQPKENCDSLFFSYLFKLQSVVHKFYRNSQGMVSDTWMCKYKDLAIVKFSAPSCTEEQNAIATMLLSADEEIAKHNEHMESLKIQKRGLMQQLLTGKKRVKIDE